jgi:hypothetical protein
LPIGAANLLGAAEAQAQGPSSGAGARPISQAHSS